MNINEYSYFELPLTMTSEHGILKIKKIQVVHEGHPVETYLRNAPMHRDILTMKNYRQWWEIVSIEVDPDSCRRGYGTGLIQEFIRAQDPNMIVLQAGIMNESLYITLEKDNNIKSFIYSNLVPFYEKNGFVDVNDIFHYNESVVMVYPASIAEEIKK